MKLSEQTITTLKNFSTINKGLLVRKGNTQRTMEENKRIIAEVELQDSFPIGFGFGDLNQFLGNLSTFENPEVEFEGTLESDTTLAKKLIIKDDLLKLEYFSTSPKNIETPPEKPLIMKNVDAKFELTDKVLKRVLQTSNINSLPNITIKSKDGNMELVASDVMNKTSASVRVDLGEYKGKDFSVDFLAENFRMIPGSYDVELMIGGFSKFTNKNKPISYVIAIETPKKK